jgi:hypothetical protein
MSLNPRRHPFRGGAEHYDIPWISKIPIRLNSLNRDCFDSTDGLSLGSTLNLPDSGMRGSTYAAIGVARFDITLGLSCRPVWYLNVDCHDQIHRPVHPANQRCSFNHLRPDCVFSSNIYDTTSDAPLKTERPNGFRCSLRPKFNYWPIRVFIRLVWNAQFDLRPPCCAFTANSIGIARRCSGEEIHNRCWRSRHCRGVAVGPYRPHWQTFRRPSRLRDSPGVRHFLEILCSVCEPHLALSTDDSTCSVEWHPCHRNYMHTG